MGMPRWKTAWSVKMLAMLTAACAEVAATKEKASNPKSFMGIRENIERNLAICIGIG